MSSKITTGETYCIGSGFAGELFSVILCRGGVFIQNDTTPYYPSETAMEGCSRVAEMEAALFVARCLENAAHSIRDKVKNDELAAD